MKKHKWWHFWFTNNLIIPYKIVDTWYGSTVIYKKVYCSLCGKVVKERYQNE